MDIDWKIVTENQGQFLDFSVNTNPFGVPPRMEQSSGDFVSTFGFYPDSKCQTLRKALSEKYSIPPKFIYCGSGADDIIYRLVFALHPKRALILEPTFEEYGRALSLTGCEISHFQLTEKQNFHLDIEHFLSAIDRIDILFICNPNNPTGQLIKHEDIVQILKRCEKNNVICVVDECFMEMLQDWRTLSVKQESKSYPQLVVVDAFTKTYAIPGLRLGFAVTGFGKCCRLLGVDNNAHHRWRSRLGRTAQGIRRRRRHSHFFFARSKQDKQYKQAWQQHRHNLRK